MTSKLSEELDLAIYERGYQSFLLKRRKKNPLFNNNLDSFHKALAANRKVIPSAPCQARTGRPQNWSLARIFKVHHSKEAFPKR